LVDGDKFCRACGSDLKTIALELADRQLPSKAGKNKTRAPKKEKTWLEKRGEGVRKAAEGATMLGGALLIGLIFNLLSSHPDRMIIWAGIFGWIACWGVFSLASGLGAIMQAATMGAKATRSQPAADPGRFSDTDTLTSPALFPPPSVTEYTTESLGNQAPSSKHSG
jgi:hypothetical protein